MYLGFGLRDPDFLLLRDVLANTWKGGTRDHYAIMATSVMAKCALAQELRDPLFPTKRPARPDGSRDHSPLLSLLDELLKPAVLSPAGDIPGENFPELILALLRYAHGLMRVIQ